MRRHFSAPLPSTIVIDGREEHNYDIWIRGVGQFLKHKFADSQNNFDRMQARVQFWRERAKSSWAWEEWRSGRRRICLYHVCFAIPTASANSAGYGSAMVWEMPKWLPVQAKAALAKAFNDFILKEESSPEEWLYIILHGIPKPGEHLKGQFVLSNLRWIGMADVLQNMVCQVIVVGGRALGPS